MHRYQLLKKSALLWALVEKALKLKSSGLGTMSLTFELAKQEDEIKAVMAAADEFVLLEYIAASKGLDSTFDAIDALESEKGGTFKARAFDYFIVALAEELTA